MTLKRKSRVGVESLIKSENMNKVEWVKKKLEKVWKNLKIELKEEVIRLVEMGKDNNWIKEGRNYQYSMNGKDKRDDYMEVKLFPNGICEVFEESVRDEHTHVNEHGLGIYTQSNHAL
jgi:hypothetical protein